MQQEYANNGIDNHHGGVVLVGDYSYGHADSKGWTSQEFLSGKPAWQEKGKLGKGSLIYADGRLYCRTEDKGTMALLEPTPSAYKEISRFEQPDRSRLKAWPHPVIADGKLYLRDQDNLFCYDVKQK